MLSEPTQIILALRKIDPELATEKNIVLINTAEYSVLIIDTLKRLKFAGLLDKQRAEKVIEEMSKVAELAAIKTKGNELFDCYIRDCIGEDLASYTKAFDNIKTTSYNLKEILMLFKSIQEKIEELQLKDAKLIYEIYNQVSFNGYFNTLKMRLFLNEPVLVAMVQAGNNLSKVTTALLEVADLLQFDEERLATSMSIIDVIKESKEASIKVSRAILRLNQYGLLVKGYVEALRGEGDRVDEKVKEIIYEHIKSLLRVGVVDEEKLQAMVVPVKSMITLSYSIALKQFIDGISEVIKRIKEYGLFEYTEEFYGEIIEAENPNQVITSLLQSRIFNGLKYAGGNVTAVLKALSLLNYPDMSPIISEEYTIKAIAQAGVNAETVAKAFIFLDKKCNIVSILNPEVITQLSLAGAMALELADTLFDSYLQALLTLGAFTVEEKKSLTDIIKSKDDNRVKYVVEGLENISKKIKKTKPLFPKSSLKAIFCACIDYWDFRASDVSNTLRLFEDDCVLDSMASTQYPQVLSQSIASMTALLSRIGDKKKMVIDALFAAGENAESLSITFKDMYIYDQDIFGGDHAPLIIQLLVKAAGRTYELRKALHMLNSAQILTELSAEQYIKELSESIDPLQKANELIEEAIRLSYQKYVIEDVSSKIKDIQEVKDKISALRIVKQRGRANSFDSPYLKIKELIPYDLQKQNRISSIIYNRILEQKGSYTVLKLFSNQYVLKVIIEAELYAGQLSHALVKLNPDLLYFNVKHSERIVNVIVAAGSNAGIVVQAFNIIWDARFLFGERTPRIIEQIEGEQSNAVIKAKQLIGGFVGEMLACISPVFSKEKYITKIMYSFSLGEDLKLIALQKYEEDIKALWETLKKLYPEGEYPSEDVVDLIFDTVVDSLNFYIRDRRDGSIINYAKKLTGLLNSIHGPAVFMAIKEHKSGDAVFRKRLTILLSPRNEELADKSAFVDTVLGVDERSIDKLEQAFTQIIKASMEGRGLLTDDAIRSLGTAEDPYQTAWRLIRKTQVPEEKELGPSLTGRLGVTKPILRGGYQQLEQRLQQKVTFFGEIRFNDDTRKPLSEVYCRARK